MAGGYIGLETLSETLKNPNPKSYMAHLFHDHFEVTGRGVTPRREAAHLVGAESAALENLLRVPEKHNSCTGVRVRLAFRV